MAEPHEGGHLSALQLALHLQISERSVYRLVEQGLPCRRYLGKTRFVLPEVEAFLRELSARERPTVAAVSPQHDVVTMLKRQVRLANGG